VRLAWNAPNENAFRIFRKAGDQQTPTLLGTSDKPEYLDAVIEYGKTYQYYVQAIHDKTESDVVESNSIAPKDVFPPRVPTGLTASPGVGAVELAWTRNTEPDFKEYRVLRSEENAAFVQIADGLVGPAYSDRQVQPGKHYRYRVSALDQAGNQSDPSEPVEVSMP
jgi:fibronectin type 3 domain-containing protein